MKGMIRLLAVMMVGLAATAAGDKGWKLPPETTKLESAPGMQLVTAQCLICHSADYISTQPRLNRATWTATVLKMRDKYGAPIQTNLVDAVADYLTKAYGSEKPK
jgi:hypothetical protein